MKNYIFAAFNYFITVYLLISILICVVGIEDSGTKSCRHPARIYTAFPTFKLGCHLGEESE